jgi:hypothetical protein
VDRSTIGRWERGESEPQPWNRPALSRALDISADQLDLLLRDESPNAITQDPYVGTFAAAANDPESLGHAVGRFGASGAWVSPTEPGSTLDRSSFGDLPTVTELRDSVHELDAQYDRLPSESLIARTGQCLGQIDLLAAYARSERAARGLDRIEADAATLMGQLVWDVSQRRANGLSRGYFGRAIDAAQRAHDPVAEALALLRKSFVALYGERDPHAGLALILTCAAVARGASHVLEGLAVLHAAEAYAMLGDGPECERALGDAESHFAAVGPDDPAFSLYSSSQFERMAGSCYLSLGRTARAESILTAAAVSGDISPKSRAIVLGNLSIARIRRGSMGPAVEALHQAIDAVEATRGGGGINLIFAAGRQLQPWRQTPEVAQLHDRLLMLMTA